MICLLIYGVADQLFLDSVCDALGIEPILKRPASGVEHRLHFAVLLQGPAGRPDAQRARTHAADDAGQARPTVTG